MLDMDISPHWKAAVRADDDIPRWVSDMLDTEFEWLVPLAAKMYREYDFASLYPGVFGGMWPSTVQLVSSLRNRYGPKASDLNAPLEALLERHDIFMWVKRNRRGSPTVRFGFTPFLARLKTAPRADFNLRTGEPPERAVIEKYYFMLDDIEV
jgi:hypothetical protein